MDVTQRLRKTIIIAEDDLTTDPVFANNRLWNDKKKIQNEMRYSTDAYVMQVYGFKEAQNENWNENIVRFSFSAFLIVRPVGFLRLLLRAISNENFSRDIILPKKNTTFENVNKSKNTKKSKQRSTK